MNASTNIGGETVRALQDQSGARIKVDPNGDHDSPERTVNIFGKCYIVVASCACYRWRLLLRMNVGSSNTKYYVFVIANR